MTHSPDTADTTCDLLLDGGVVITLEETHQVIEKGSVAIRGDRLVAIGNSLEMAPYRASAIRTIDCSGKVIMPGLTDGHTHLFQTLGRGMGDGLSLVPWLRRFMFPYAKTISGETATAGARLGALQAALAGTTVVVDNHYGPTDTATTLAVADAIESVGIRGAVARGIFGDPNRGGEIMGVAPELFPWTNDQEIAITRECIEARPAGSRVEIWPGPENIVYVTPELIEASAQLAADSDVRWHMHCSESAAEIEFFESIYGMRPVAWLAQEQLLSSRTTLAHAIWLDDDEVSAIGEHQTTTVHNPVSNQYIASGVMRLEALQMAGANVALGSDGIAITGQDMFEAMKAGILLHRVHNLDPSATTVEQFIEIAAKGGAKMTGVEAGTLAPGRLADVIVMDIDKVHHTPWNRPVASVVYAGTGIDVELSIVGGEIIVENGKSTQVDEDEVRAKATEAAERLIAEADLSGLTRGWFSPSAT
ncbi:MAG: amidohydrolase family protein [Acidimicrobiia bacterium]|nr:MAG: amidohydrolase family protein [Acidimicrobiia bacterium]